MNDSGTSLNEKHIFVTAWSAKDEDVVNNFAASDDNNGKDVVPFSTNVDANDNMAEQERTSINGSRGMLQKMKKNVVVPVDEEPSGSESGTTRINVKGKRDGRYCISIFCVFD